MTKTKVTIRGLFLQQKKLTKRPVPALRLNFSGTLDSLKNPAVLFSCDGSAGPRKKNQKRSPRGKEAGEKAKKLLNLGALSMLKNQRNSALVTHLLVKVIDRRMER
jgi:hypothetical protein